MSRSLYYTQAIASESRCVLVLRESGALLERTRVTGWISCAGAERGFQAAQLLSPFALVMAGCDQGGVPRSRQHRRKLRPRGAQPVVRNAVAERRLAQILREADDAPRFHAVQCFPARQVLLPVLRLE